MNYDDFIRTRRYVEDAGAALPFWDESWEPWLRRVCERRAWPYPDVIGAYVYGLPDDPLVIFDAKHVAGRWLLNLEDSDLFGDDLDALERSLFECASDPYDEEEWQKFVTSWPG
ncbi:hypothetical protein [Polyangium sp. 15x6]|uniref:hypothetical protein n=1 Tax=Polyangium sp. 15x6 TaxID=3042687 RepID=UPI00249C2A17|nr:hypothetical protein [Polyangium sp. 15x6]MDI3288486.1 hypothetical protein [Polyangium sp. 15x6]